MQILMLMRSRVHAINSHRSSQLPCLNTPCIEDLPHGCIEMFYGAIQCPVSWMVEDSK